MAHFMSLRIDLPVHDMQRTLPRDLIELCNVSEPRIPEDNSDWAPTSLLAQLMPLECNQETYVHFLGFFRTLQAGFKALLLRKDHAAMLLLLFWYGKTLTFHAWWLEKRASLEDRAICIYLQKSYADNDRIMNLVNYVQSTYGV